MRTRLYALDFDGVICDSAVETGLTGWKVASALWADMPACMPDTVLDSFRAVRPVMETGFEAILIVRLLYQGMNETELMAGFPHQIEALMLRERLEIDALKQRFATCRDRWIAEDMDDWIAMNPLYDGLRGKLRSLDTRDCVIITTKQERFVDQILRASDIELPPAQIYGLDRGLRKPDILHALVSRGSHSQYLFIEDRLPTLLEVIADDRLEAVQLYLADWGYNTAADRIATTATGRISTLDLAELPAL